MCKKKCYESELDAMLKLCTLQSAGNAHKRDKTERVAYYCGRHDKWHLSSQEIQ